MKPITLTLLCWLLIHDSFAQSYKGSIVGLVVDASTQEPLVGATVTVMERTGVGTSTDIGGRFTIGMLDVGTYSLRVSLVGYNPQVLTNVVVSTGRHTPVRVEMRESIIKTEEVTVQADYFRRSQQVSPVSANVLGRSEVLRSPGGIQDVQRVVQALPGVASSTDNINELIVRGGAPFENLTVVDGMEVPSINHYSNQHNSAGPINMLNADMIQDVQFSAGGFPVRFGDKSSSVMNISVREGNRDRAFSSSSGFNMAGYGALLEGAIDGGRSSYIVSARQSLLQLIDKIVGLSKLSLTAVPRYWDTHSKIVYDLSPSQRLKFNFLYGESRIDIEGDPKEEDTQRRNVTDSSSVERIYPFNRQLVAGLNWQTLWGKAGYSMLTLYSVSSTYNVNVYSDYTRFTRGPRGEVLDFQKLNSRPIFTNRSEEAYVAAKYEVLLQPYPRHEVNAGLQVQTSRRWENVFVVEGDTTRYDRDRDGTFETGPVIVPQALFSQSLGFGAASKYFAFIGDRFSITPDLAMTLGVRYDHFTYSGRGAFSTRASLSYTLVQPSTTLSLAFGRYPQTHPLPYYGDRRDIGYNRHLAHMYADHAVIGLGHILEDGLKMSIEAYVKSYSGVAVSEDFVHSAIDTFWSDRNLTVGKRRSYGAEIFLEKKQVHDFFGTLSISFSKTEDADPRIPRRVEYYPSDFDYRWIVTALGGHIVRGIRDALDDTPFFIKYPSYLLPLSNEVEISFKYRFQSGRPYTPKMFVTWQQAREGGITWSKGAWVESDRINSTRYPNYSRLDIQWISRFYFEKWNINVFVALQNVLNTKNVFFESHRSDGTVETVHQFAFFPVAGVEVEF
ncbi:MAG: TonB-dependent receptor [Bacteroidota bacterium]